MNRRRRWASTAVLLGILAGGCVDGMPWAAPPGPTGDCSDAIVSLDIDGDGEFDDVLHALEETGPVLRVCLHDGPLSEMGGGGTFDEEDGWPVYDFWRCADMDADGRIDLVSADGVRVRPDLYAFDLTGYTIAGATAREIGSERIESPAPDRMAPNDPYRCPPNA